MLSVEPFRTKKRKMIQILFKSIIWGALRIVRPISGAASANLPAAKNISQISEVPLALLYKRALKIALSKLLESSINAHLAI